MIDELGFDLQSPPSDENTLPNSNVDKPPQGIIRNFEEYTADQDELAELDPMGQARVSDIQNNTTLRKNLAEFSMLVTIVSLAIWGTVILFQVIGKMSGIEVFSDIQFATITTGCTVNILAVIIGVIKGLFNSQKKSWKKK